MIDTLKQNPEQIASDIMDCMLLDASLVVKSKNQTQVKRSKKQP